MLLITKNKLTYNFKKFQTCLSWNRPNHNMAAEPARTAEDGGEGAAFGRGVRASYDFSTFEGLQQFNENSEKMAFNFASIDKYQNDYVSGNLQLTTIL